MGDSLEAWMQSGRYLPGFMRDFHDQKELFKFLDEVRARADAKEGSMRSLEAVTWSAAHIYTVDIFLWVMAKHGYTLRRARKPFSFGNIVESVSAATKRTRNQFAAIFRAGLAVAVLSLLSAQAQASDIRIPSGFMLCHTALEAASANHAGCYFARGGQKVERITAAVTWSQMIIRSSDSSETMTVYALKADADRLQVGAP